MKTPSPGDEIARITLVLYGDGEMGINGNVGDVKLALGMIDHARDAVKSQLGHRPDTIDKGIYLPSSSVQVRQNLDQYPVELKGDRK